uniref:protein disulfide-isomerase n=1 Tax=Lygus hesperus TaxID=30085 RepID=A0A0K8S4V4_LYGHE
MNLHIFSISLLIGGVLSKDMSPTAYFPELTDKDFKDEISRSGIVLVMFMAPWCGHCQKLHPEVELAAKMLRKSPYPLLIAQVDCTKKGKKTCTKAQVTGYPTLKIYKNGPFWKEYDGPRTAKGIAEYMTRHARPCPAEIKNEANIEELASDDNAFVAFFKKGTKDNVLKDAFLKLAEEQRGHLRMGFSEDPDLILNHCPSYGVVFVRNKWLRNKFEPDEVVYDGEETQVALEEWMKNVQHGIVGLRTPSNIRDFTLPVVVAYYDVDYEKNPKSTNYWRNRILKVAKDYKDDFKFAISSKFDFAGDFGAYGYTSFPGKGKEPIILAKTHSGKFKMNDSFTVEAFDEFLKKLKADELKPYFKAEEPTKQGTENPIITVVEKTFENLVLKSGKDSFILFYSSKTNEGMEFQAHWYNLAEELVGEDVDVLQMDYAYNEMPDNYKLVGTYSVYWVPKNDKSHPVIYGGNKGEGRTYPSLLRYVCRKATEELKYRNRKGKLKKIEEKKSGQKKSEQKKSEQKKSEQKESEPKKPDLEKTEL